MGQSSSLSIILASAICCASIVWLYSNLDRKYHYDYYPDLYNSTTHNWNYPKNFMNMTRNILKPDDWLEGVNAREQLYESSLFWNTMALVWLQHDYASASDLALSGQPVANSAKCGKQLTWILDSLKEMPEPATIAGTKGYQLTRYLDSFGRPEPALHWAGALNWFGSHSMCLKANLDGDRIKSRYCLAHFRYDSWPKVDIIRPKMKIKLGICLPETCDTKSLDEYKQQIEFLAKYQLNEALKRDLVFDSMYCLPDERSPLRQIPLAGRFLVWLMFCWFALILVASSMRNKYGNKFGSLFNALTLQKSLESFTSSRVSTANVNSKPKHAQSQHSNLVDLRAWNFLKVVSSFMVIYGHTNSVTHFYTRTFIGRLLQSNRFWSRICFTFGNLMTTYFVLFGLFSSLKLLNSMNGRRLRRLLSLKTIFNFVSPIIGHIVPLYALVHFFNQLIIPYLGSGPAWDYGTGLSLRRLCMEESWWRSIPLLATIWGHIAPPCNSPGWFVVVYLQLAPIVPLLTYILAKLPSLSLKLAFTSFLLFISSLNSFIRLLSQNVIDADGMSYINGFVVLVLDKYEPSSYQDTLGRLGTVTLGCLVGVLLNDYKTKSQVDAKQSDDDVAKRTHFQWPRCITGRLMYWLVPLAHLALIVIPSLAKTVHNDVSLVEFAIIIALSGLSWALLNAALIIQLANANPSNMLMSFMNHPLWHSMNKLNLAIYLLHLETIIYANQVHEHAPSVYGHSMDFVKIYCFALWLSYVSAVIFYLFIEAPLMELLKIFYEKGRALEKIEIEANYVDTLMPKELLDEFED